MMNGTEKQNAWAEKIKAEMIRRNLSIDTFCYCVQAMGEDEKAALIAYGEKVGEERVFAEIKKEMEEVASQFNDAKWYIENRENSRALAEVAAERFIARIMAVEFEAAGDELEASGQICEAVAAWNRAAGKSLRDINALARLGEKKARHHEEEKAVFLASREEKERYTSEIEQIVKTMRSARQ